MNYEVMVIMNYIDFILNICYELCCDICFSILHWYICTYQNVNTYQNLNLLNSLWNYF
jgi:hypothetical protein